MGTDFRSTRPAPSKGYENMGWKDAGDAVVYPDGSPVKGPKALCELQGYVFDAKRRAAECAEYLGDPDLAGELRREAADLQQRFEERFWCEDLGYLRLRLGWRQEAGQDDRLQRRPSCSGAASSVRTAPNEWCERLREPDMWSGWGIRTLSARHPAYNPFSYQNGSVWPHDNGIIAMGFKRYGFAEEAALIARDISEAGQLFLSSIACRSCMPASNGSRGRFRCNISAPMCRRPGRRAVCFICSGPSWGLRRMRPREGSTSIPCFHCGCRTSRSVNFGSAGDARPSLLARRDSHQA